MEIINDISIESERSFNTPDERIFVETIQINYVNHLKDLRLDISQSDRKHIIITGKNGSGKTSLLSAIRNSIVSKIFNWPNLDSSALGNILNMYYGNITNIDQQLKSVVDYSNNTRNSQSPYIFDNTSAVSGLLRQKKEYQSLIEIIHPILSGFRTPVEVSLKNEYLLLNNYFSNNIIFCFFDAKRQSFVGAADGITRQTNINSSASSLFRNENINFLQYIINLRAEQALAREDGDYESASKVTKWFDRFTEQLKILLNESELKLNFDRRNISFSLEVPGKRIFDFNTLSDGYSAIMSIITEIMLRMNNRLENYDVQGIVLIDEIETHLHIELQKKILPFLNSFFPNIQFIVTTHSPFVLNSVPNTVVYDLEKQTRYEDLSGYSMDGLVEEYFDQGTYSDVVIKRIDLYEKLTSNMQRTEKEEVMFNYLKRYFEELPKFFSEELELKLQQIKLAEIQM